MSVQKTKDKIADEAYQVVEATNDDGTIDAEIVETPYRDNDDLVVKARPLIPNAEVEEFRLDWPNKDTSKFKAVRLARSKVGGFQAISQLENERIKVDETENGWSLVIPEQEQKDLDWIMPYVSSGAFSGFKSLVVILFFSSLIGLITPFALLLMYPFGIAILSVWQGVSVFVASFAVLVVTAFLMDEVFDDE